jgi:hypothetical protein
MPIGPRVIIKILLGPFTVFAVLLSLNLFWRKMMLYPYLQLLIRPSMFFIVAVMAPFLAVAAPPAPSFYWSTVVNNGDTIPDSTKMFNSYNQPSVNNEGLVVFRARGKGPGEPPHGIYTRDMAIMDGPVIKISDRNSPVPAPNNLNETFIEFPSFPRIDPQSNTLAFRGNSKPVWSYTVDGEDSRAGTSGIYTNPSGTLITGASKLGAVPGFGYFEVPSTTPGTSFDVFPGAPSVTKANTIVFKGNYTDPNHEGSETGVYYRQVLKNGGVAPVQLIANNVATKIPGTQTLFGSTAPPSAAKGKAVFAGFDNEEEPTVGGIYLTQLKPKSALATLVRIGSPVPEVASETFNRIGEGLSFDGRYVGFWGAWGSATKEVNVECPKEGNKNLRAYCLLQSPLKEGEGLDPTNPDNHTGQYVLYVPLNQGIFVHDTLKRKTVMVAQTGQEFSNFVYWNFSGKAPGTGEGEESDDGELARWRSAAFVAVDGIGKSFLAAFKATKVNGLNGIYMGAGPNSNLSIPLTVVDTTTDGGVLDPAAAGLQITEIGIERDAFRNGKLVINASMGTEETGWAGIYIGELH